MRRKKKVEILAPAGSYESMLAAIAAGADAVYIGGSRFGARAFADNLTEDRMLEAIDYAHLHGCYLYMTVNTLMKDCELQELYDYLKPYYERGLDAVIVQDLGAFEYIKRNFPDLDLHASTQMTITGELGAKKLKELGASRVVTARELSLEEIEKIHKNVDVEIESFVHGALCYGYSGQCFFSSLIGGRSGNRGRCAQPCRLPYGVYDSVINCGKCVPGSKAVNQGDQKYVLSLKDLNTLDILPQIIEAGVYSLKIEGRMKSPRYTAGVVSIYRKYVDQYLSEGRKHYKVSSADKKMLLDLFDRGGQTEGYYKNHNGKDMVVIKEKPAFREGNKELFDYLDKTYVNAKLQEKITGKIMMCVGECAKLCLSFHDKNTGEIIETVVTGSKVEQAQKQPLSVEKIKSQMEKTGNSPFVFEHLDVEVKGEVFLPMGALNELRRNGLDALESQILSQYRRVAGEKKESVVYRNEKDHMPVKIHVMVQKQDVFDTMLKIEEIQELSIDSCWFMPDTWEILCEKAKEYNKKCYLVMPQIFREEAIQYFTKNETALKTAGFSGLVVRTLEEVQFLKEHQIGLPLIFDFGMYTFNQEAACAMVHQNAQRLTMPIELNSRELAVRESSKDELIVYGYLPMLVSAQCIQKTIKGCSKKQGFLWLKDRMKKDMLVENHCLFCYNTIYNSSPLSLLDQESTISKLQPGSLRLQFVIETPEEANKIVKAYIDRFIYHKDVENPVNDFTRGHFKRGVE